MRPILVNYRSVWFQKASRMTANITSIMNNLKNLTGNGQSSLLISCFASSQCSFWRNTNKTFSFSCVQHKVGMILELVSLMRTVVSLSAVSNSQLMSMPSFAARRCLCTWSCSSSSWLGCQSRERMRSMFRAYMVWEGITPR